ncbi:MAG: hypothetical protein RIM99_20305 [Cyclobacteriaceae bacterium]
MKFLITIGVFSLIFWSCTEDESEDCLQIQWYYDKDEDALGDMTKE